MSTVAIDGTGRELWEMQGSLQHYALARLLPGEATRVVGVEAPDAASERMQELSVFDGRDGELLRTIGLPEGAQFHPALSPTYGAEVDAADLDGDGLDEILISYHHVPYWPSYIVLYEPLVGRSRVIFSGSGHHRYWKAIDLDGDGGRELVLVGINNRLGFTGAITALKLDPPVNSTSASSSILFASPDAAAPAQAHQAYWYALIDGNRCPRPRDIGCWSADFASSELTYDTGRDETIHLSFDGFLMNVESSLSPMDRRSARQETYRSLRLALAADRLGTSEDALAEIERAAVAVESAADPYLSNWVQRTKGQLLIRSGRVAEGEAVFENLSQRGEREHPDVAYQAA
jgi:hypothetical protein